MIKRNWPAILIIASCILNIINIDFYNISQPEEYWFLIASSLIIVLTIVGVYITESKNRKKRNNHNEIDIKIPHSSGEK